jgi:predicted AAA+ superfamily ATPase
MIARTSDLELVRAALRRSRVVALLGPRQCGKTTLARQFVPAESLNYFDLEDSQSLASLTEPDIALRALKDWSSSTKSSAERIYSRCCACWRMASRCLPEF